MNLVAVRFGNVARSTPCWVLSCGCTAAANVGDVDMSACVVAAARELAMAPRFAVGLADGMRCGKEQLSCGNLPNRFRIWRGFVNFAFAGTSRKNG